MDSKNFGFETLQIHAGQKPDATTKATGLPLYLSNAFTFDDANQAARIFALEEGGYFYSRLSNPTVDALQTRMAALDGGVGAVAFSSGTAAIMGLIMTVCQSGDEIVAANNLYGGTIGSLSGTMVAMGFKSHFVDPKDLNALEAAINDKTKIIFVESVGNPNGDMLDFDAISAIAKKYGILLVVDNTTPTPYLFRPIEHGCDIVVHSATKFIGGHGTTLGGIIVDSGNFDWRASGKFPQLTKPDASYHNVVFDEVAGNKAYITRIRAIYLRDTGAAISPFNAFLLLQGVETLSLRVERHVENALKIVDYLNNHPLVEKVNHPSLKDSSYNHLYKRYFKNGAGSIFTFEIKGGALEAKKFIDSLEIFSLLANVADVKSLVIHPASTTHSQMNEQELLNSGIKPNTIRLSIGTEHICDLIEDLDNAFKQI